MPHPLKRHTALKFFTENKLFYFSKRALLTGAASNKWLKEVLLIPSPEKKNKIN